MFSMAVGLASGMGFILYSIVIAVLHCCMMLFLELVRFGQWVDTPKILKIVVPENLNFQNTFDEVFNEYASSFQLIKIKTIELGSLYELEYAIQTKKEMNEKEFIDKLRCRNGNMNISLFLDSWSR